MTATLSGEGTLTLGGLASLNAAVALTGEGTLGTGGKPGPPVDAAP